MKKDFVQHYSYLLNTAEPKNGLECSILIAFTFTMEGPFVGNGEVFDKETQVNPVQSKAVLQKALPQIRPYLPTIQPSKHPGMTANQGNPPDGAANEKLKDFQ